MKSEPICALPEFVVRGELRALRRRSHRSMVNAEPLGKRPCAPALHPGRQHRHHIDAAVFERLVAADLLETLAAKQLTRAGHMFDAAESVVVRDAAFLERRPRDAELRIGLELAE